jgi:hypothetical protein
MGIFKPLEPGSVYGRITVLFNYISNAQRRLNSRCVCECGNIFNTHTRNIRNGITQSCGCLQRERTSEAGVELGRKYREKRGLDPDIALRTQNAQDRVLFMETVGRNTKIRDKYTCLLCGLYSREMCSHHLSPWVSDKENRFNYSNIATLCKECHLHKVHRGNTTQEPDSELTKILIEKVAAKYK